MNFIVKLFLKKYTKKMSKVVNEYNNNEDSKKDEDISRDDMFKALEALDEKENAIDELCSLMTSEIEELSDVKEVHSEIRAIIRKKLYEN